VDPEGCIDKQAQVDETKLARNVLRTAAGCNYQWDIARPT